MASFAIITPGLYKAQILEAEWLPNKNKNGHYVRMTFKIVSNDSFRGEKVSNWFNFDNPSPKTCEIALKQWSKLCDAAGVNLITFKVKIGPSEDQLLSLCGHMVELEIKNRDSEYNGKVYTFNDVNDFFKLPNSASFRADAYDTKNVSTLPGIANCKEEHPNYDDLNDDIPF